MNVFRRDIFLLNDGYFLIAWFPGILCISHLKLHFLLIIQINVSSLFTKKYDYDITNTFFSLWQQGVVFHKSNVTSMGCWYHMLLE